MFNQIRGKHPELWLRGYLLQKLRNGRVALQGHKPQHVLFAVCDHFEPLWAGHGGKADHATGLQRVERWRAAYPILADRYRDSDGRLPRHSFFFPIEEYHPELLHSLDELVRRGYGEVEVHLHHDNDTDAGLERTLRMGLKQYENHGHLARSSAGRPRYAFIHGNWALCNGRPDGRYCGVDGELAILQRTGCYADFTFPSCPDITQSNQVNCIYWPTGDLSMRRAYAQGKACRVGDRIVDRPLFVTGPLGVGWHASKRRPRLEYGVITDSDPASISRARHWLRCNIHVVGRPEWVFIKLYTHGAPEKLAASLLGAGGDALHSALRALADEQHWKLHYVTAREMYNIARAAMTGLSGDPGVYRDFELAPPPIAAIR